MIVIDVDWNTLRQIRMDSGSKFFFVDYPETTEVYAAMNGMLFRFTRRKLGAEKDMLFFSEDLKGSIRALGISNVNEAEWQAWATRVVELLEKKGGTM